MRILVTGATGLVGSALVPALKTAGHEVIRAVRYQTQEPDNIFWNPEGGDIYAASLSGFDAAINLAGENIAERWTEAKKKRIRDSRVKGNKALAEALSKASPTPRVFVTASAIGYYGNRGGFIMDEASSTGEGFLAEVCREVEAAASTASSSGIRVVQLRIGIVLSPDGGALAKMLPPFKLGLGGKIGNGEQYMSWIALDDVVGVIEHVLETESISGPVNTVAPNPVTNREFTKTLGRVISRPTIFPIPAFGLRLMFGREMADETLLSSTRVEPKKLTESGYSFKYPTLDEALRHVMK